MSPKCQTCGKPGKWPNAGYCLRCGDWTHIKCRCLCFPAGGVVWAEKATLKHAGPRNEPATPQTPD